MSILFLDREEELRLLEEEYRRNSSSLVIVYGRRRIGKTTLINRFLEGKKGVYIYAERIPLQRFLEKVGSNFNARFASLDEFLEHIFKLKERLILAVDEYQRVARGFSEKLQHYWDLLGQNSKLMTILSGSYVGMMERDITYTGPLYGRATKILKITGFNYPIVRDYLGLKERESITVYSILGGVPYYITLYSKQHSIIENIRRLFVDLGAPLYREVETILSYEFRDLSRYLLILEALAKGHQTLKEISDFIKIERFKLKKYLLTLERTDIIGKEEIIPRTRIPRYYIKDHMFNFYMRFLYPNEEQLEIGGKEFVLNEIEKNLSSYIGRQFERIARETLSWLMGLKFHRYIEATTEVDAIATKDKKAILVEAKSGEVDERDIQLLNVKAEEICNKLNLRLASAFILTPDTTNHKLGTIGMNNLLNGKTRIELGNRP